MPASQTTSRIVLNLPQWFIPHVQVCGIHFISIGTFKYNCIIHRFIGHKNHQVLTIFFLLQKCKIVQNCEYSAQYMHTTQVHRWYCLSSSSSSVCCMNHSDPDPPRNLYPPLQSTTDHSTSTVVIITPGCRCECMQNGRRVNSCRCVHTYLCSWTRRWRESLLRGSLPISPAFAPWWKIFGQYWIAANTQ